MHRRRRSNNAKSSSRHFSRFKSALLRWAERRCSRLTGINPDYARSYWTPPLTPSLAFDLERLNELEFFDASGDGADNGFRRILVTEGSHPYLSGWWPPGHTLGWEHTFTHQARDLLTAIADGTQPLPSFGDGLAVQRVLDAVARSAASGNSWESVSN